MEKNQRMKRFFIRTLGLVAGAFVLAIIVNLFRPNPLEWVAKEPYEIFQDCPESTVLSKKFSASALLENPAHYLILDSRPKAVFDKRSIKGTYWVLYDALFPVDKAEIERIRLLASGRHVVVIGTDPIAKLTADDLSSQGLKNVHYLSEPGIFEKLEAKLGVMP